MAFVFTPRPFSGWHVPPLFLATAFTFGGMLPMWKPTRAMREFGLPEHVVTSPPAQSCFTVYGSRMSIIGLAMYSFYLKGDLASVDTLMSLLTLAGVVDGYICWKEGVPGQGLFRFLSGVVVGGWGLLGLSSK